MERAPSDQGFQEFLPAAKEPGLPSSQGDQNLGVLRGEVGQRVGLEVRPEGLDRIELRGIGREERSVEPRSGLQKRTNRSGTVGGETIPDQTDRSPKVSPQLPKKDLHPSRSHVRVRSQRKVKSYPSTSRRDGKRGDHRHLLPRPRPLIEDRSPTPRGPTSPNQRSQHQAALVEENQRCLQSRRFFLIRGHSSLIQVRMASSSRSRARRSGFCGLQAMA